MPTVRRCSAAAGACSTRRKPFQQYDTVEGHAESAIPPDAYVPHEWTRARLMYRDYSGFGRGFRRGNGSWTIDYPRSDRHLLYGVKRLTRIDSRSVEQPVALDNSDDIYNWPMLYAVEVGHGTLNEEEAAQLRDFLNRGGFLMVDDFHGSREWEVFLEGIKQGVSGPGNRRSAEVRADLPHPVRSGRQVSDSGRAVSPQRTNL